MRGDDAGIPGHDSTLIFEATVDGKHVTGADFIRTDEAGRIDDLMVMVRPLSAANALAAAMGAQFERIRAEASEQVERDNATP